MRPCSAFGSRYLADDFWVTYDGPVDLDALTEAVALMPFVLAIVPVAWASGERWSVPELDERQVRSLPAARETLRRWYPRIPWDGELEPERTSACPPSPGGSDVILFSGGIDSTFSALSEPPGATLLLFRGLDVALDNGHGWARVRREARALAERAGHTLATGETSLRRHLRRDVIDRLHPNLYSWWGQVQHGLALAGLGAPLATATGGRVLVPGTFSSQAPHPLGSAPEVEENASWSCGEVVHHGFEHTRHGKLRRIVEHCDEQGPVFLRVCYSQAHGDGGNCLSCEKCLRCALALMIEDRDPLPFGLPLAPREVERRVRAGFEGGWQLTAVLEPFWEELRERAGEHPGLLSEGFRDWLLSHPLVRRTATAATA